MITMQELELFAQLLARVGVNPYEAAWANGFLDRLRSMIVAREAEATTSDGHDAAGRSGVSVAEQ